MLPGGRVTSQLLICDSTGTEQSCGMDAGTVEMGPVGRGGAAGVPPPMWPMLHVFGAGGWPVAPIAGTANPARGPTTNAVAAAATNSLSVLDIVMHHLRGLARGTAVLRIVISSAKAPP